jgi:hypothetical protein
MNELHWFVAPPAIGSCVPERQAAGSEILSADRRLCSSIFELEILWEDTSPEGVAWVEEEFAALWSEAYPLPEAIVHEIQRIADRVEIGFRDAREDELPAAALAESPRSTGAANNCNPDSARS